MQSRNIPKKSSSASRKNYLKEIHIDTWEQYLELVSNPPFKDWAFRGQPDSTLRLWSRISRELYNRRVKNKYWIDQENRLIRIFKRKALPFIDKVPDVNDTPQWMALIQHHGGPTRLLDFTWSPYVAAFFALESSISDSAVWAINAPELGTSAYGPKFPQDGKSPSPEEVLAQINVTGKDGISIGEPYFKNLRVVAQSGTFAFPVDITRPVDEILSGRKNIIAKLVLSINLRKKAISELYRMNITHATLFPDIDGLARSLSLELENHWQYDPTE